MVVGGVTGGLNPEELLLRSGKPVITVPAKFVPGKRSGKAVVAWDGSRAAARALTDAMQMLKHTNKLGVVRLIESGFEILTRKDCTPPPSHLFIGPLFGAIWVVVNNQMKMVAHDGVAHDFNGETP